MSWVRIPPEQLFFSFSVKKRVVQVSCVALFIYVGLRVFIRIYVCMYVCMYLPHTNTLFTLGTVKPFCSVPFHNHSIEQFWCAFTLLTHDFYYVQVNVGVSPIV